MFSDAWCSEGDKQSKELHAAIHDTETHLQALRTILQIPGWKPSSTPTSGEPVLQALEHAQSVVNGIQEWAKKEAARSTLGNLPGPAVDIAATLRQASEQLAEVTSSLVGTKRKWEDNKRCIQNELNSIHENISVDDMTYTPHAVFIHSGETPNDGHYWVYIRNADNSSGHDFAR
ncbi:hypothetical protein GQ54DRAFT_322358 [Martensiomyces pterosporus]|nr:hypothetical protein GQ54DRAFT_322358 [Martensiomyces pterosporus]